MGKITRKQNCIRLIELQGATMIARPLVFNIASIIIAGSPRNQHIGDEISQLARTIDRRGKKKRELIAIVPDPVRYLRRL